MVDKKLLTFLLVGIFAVFSLQVVSADCNLAAELVNQDPYPAVPGETLELVFQVSGVQNPDCNGAVFELMEKYPFSLAPGESAKKTLAGGTYTQNYKTEWVIPYDLVVDKDALDGKKQLEVRYKSGTGDLYYSKKFNISVKDVRVDFEISVKDYNQIEEKIIFEILNIGKYNVEALAIDMPEQENFVLKGSPRVIVGSLDSNEEDSFTFSGIPQRGNINLIVSYTDNVGERRSIEETVFFEPKYFPQTNQKGVRIWKYLIILVIAVAIFFWIRKKRKKKEHHRA